MSSVDQFSFANVSSSSLVVCIMCTPETLEKIFKMVCEMKNNTAFNIGVKRNSVQLNK